MKFFDIKYNQKGDVYVYSEFISEYGHMSNTLDDYYKDFKTLKGALDHGKGRGRKTRIIMMTDIMKKWRMK
jgi:hypothetical protein